MNLEPEEGPSRSYTVDDIQFLTASLELEPEVEKVRVLEALFGKYSPDLTLRLAERLVASTTRDERSLRILADSEFDDTQAEVAKNSQTPPDVLETLARRDNGIVAETAASNTSLPEAAIERLLSDERWGNRFVALRHPDIPRHLVDWATLDENEHVRARAAYNTKASPVSLVALADDADPDVRTAVASNTATPVETLRTLADDPEMYVRAGVGSNPAAPEDVLTRLMRDPNSWVRYKVAGNASIPLVVAAWLATDPDPTGVVRRTLARNERCPAATLKALTRRGNSWQVRDAVARNRACPVELREWLAFKDRASTVRESARSHLLHRC